MNLPVPYLGLDQRKAAGHRFQATLRALAYKWTRILWRCWKDRVAYDESAYLQALRAEGSPLVLPATAPAPTAAT